MPSYHQSIKKKHLLELMIVIIDIPGKNLIILTISSQYFHIGVLNILESAF